MKLSVGRILKGPAGTATEVLMEGKRATPDQTATLSTWFFDCPGQSPFWDNYLLSIIHLRPIEGVKPADIRVPGATHEVLLLALDPNKKPQATKLKSWSWLLPMNLCEQVELPDDKAAVVLLAQVAGAVVDGRLWAEPPLSGQKEPWRTVLVRTAAHHRGEEHAP